MKSKRIQYSYENPLRMYYNEFPKEGEYKEPFSQIRLSVQEIMLESNPVFVQGTIVRVDYNLIAGVCVEFMRESYPYHVMYLCEVKFPIEKKEIQSSYSGRFLLTNRMQDTAIKLAYEKLVTRKKTPKE